MPVGKKINDLLEERSLQRIDLKVMCIVVYIRSIINTQAINFAVIKSLGKGD